MLLVTLTLVVLNLPMWHIGIYGLHIVCVLDGEAVKEITHSK